MLSCSSFGAIEIHRTILHHSCHCKVNRGDVSAEVTVVQSGNISRKSYDTKNGSLWSDDCTHVYVRAPSRKIRRARLVGAGGSKDLELATHFGKRLSSVTSTSGFVDVIDRSVECSHMQSKRLKTSLCPVCMCRLCVIQPIHCFCQHFLKLKHLDL